MITLLIVESDLRFAKSIISTVVRNNEKMRLIDIVTTTEEAITAIKKYKPHLLIINSDIADMDKLEKVSYKPPFIAFTENPTKSAIKKYFLKTIDMKLVNKRVKQIIAENNFAQTQERLITDFAKLKFNFSRIGTAYLMECIMYSYKHKHTFLYDNLEKNIYPVIAKKHNTTAVNVKWVIVKSINEMYDRNCTENTLNNIADYFYFKSGIKPTAKIILSTFLAKLEC